MRYIQIPSDRAGRIAAGQAIMRLSETVFKTGTAAALTEWEKFDKDPAKWLHDNGYRLVGPGAPADGTIPPTLLRIQAVYDTPNVMHVKVPWAGDLDPSVPLPDGSEYTNSFPAFLSSYFIRRCR